MMHKPMAVLGWLAFALCAPAAAQQTSAQPTAQTVLDCMAAAVPENLVIVQDLRFETRSAEGAEPELLTAQLHMRVSRASSEAERHLRAMMAVQSPEYLAGAAYLLRETEQKDRDAMYVFLPSIGRVRQVSGGFANTALMGTQFSYNDFRQWQGLFGDARVAYAERDQRQGRAVHRLRITDPKPRRGGHDRVEVAVDAEHCLVMQADFYAGGQLRKQLNVDPDHLRQFGPYWYPLQLSMREVESGARTDLRVARIRASEQAPDGVFDPIRFHRVE